MAIQDRKSSNMPEPRDVLKVESMRVPDWLTAHSDNMQFPRKQFFESRVVYYPGSGSDGHPLRLFGGSHSAHCFVFSDYGYSASYFEKQLIEENYRECPKGYRPLFVKHLTETELQPDGWVRHLNIHHKENYFSSERSIGVPFALWAVLDRKETFDDNHGPARLAILIVGGDGIATYDALFCQSECSPPYAVVIQDHGFGGNYATFGGDDSPLWDLARDYALPKWILVADGTKPWPGYREVSKADNGGMHGSPRRLFYNEKL